MRDQLLKALDGLGDRERWVLQLRYGLDGGDLQTLEEVGKVFGVTREPIRQIEAKATRELRQPAQLAQLSIIWIDRGLGINGCSSGGG